MTSLSTRDFDAGRIDPASVRFGPGNAQPIASKVIGRRNSDDRIEEREEWEKITLQIKGEESRKTNRANLLLSFDLTALEIRCVLDRAIFLKAKTIDGQNIIGGATTKLMGCDVRNPDVRARKKSGK